MNYFKKCLEFQLSFVSFASYGMKFFVCWLIFSRNFIDVAGILFSMLFSLGLYTLPTGFCHYLFLAPWSSLSRTRSHMCHVWSPVLQSYWCYKSCFWVWECLNPGWSGKESWLPLISWIEVSALAMVTILLKLLSHSSGKLNPTSRFHSQSLAGALTEEECFWAPVSTPPHFTVLILPRNLLG